MFDNFLEALIIVAVVFFMWLAEKLYNCYIKGTRWEQMIDIVTAAVRAAEQTVTESGKGAYKKEIVMKLCKQLIPDISDQELDILIESAVYNMKEAAKKIAVV